MLLTFSATEPNDERDEFLAEFQRIQQEIESTVAASSCGAPAKNAWIAKANRGAKGEAARFAHP